MWGVVRSALRITFTPDRTLGCASQAPRHILRAMATGSRGNSGSLDRRTYGELLSLMKAELNRAKKLAGGTQLDLSNKMGYASQATVSKLLRGRQATIPDDKALNLDEWMSEVGAGTDSGFTFVELASALRDAWEADQAKTTDVFVASPMSTNIKGAYKKRQSLAMEVVRALRSHQLRTYFAGEHIDGSPDFDDSELAYNANLRHIEDSKAFVLYLPPAPAKPADLALASLQAPSSIWVELGIALGRGMPCTVIAPGTDLIPYVVRRAIKDQSRAGKNTLEVYFYGRNPKEPARLIERHGKSWLAGGTNL